MKTIWKYEIQTTNVQTIDMPTGATILCVQIQDGVPCIWAMVESKHGSLEMRTIVIYETGYQIDRPDLRYIGTYQDDIFVFHVFEMNQLMN